MQVIEGVRVTDSIEEVVSEVSRLRGAGVDVGFDFETTGLSVFSLYPVTLALKPRGKQATIIDMRQMDKEDLQYLGSVLEPLFDGSITLVGQNLKFDFSIALVHMGLAGHKAYDCMLAEQVITGMGWAAAKAKGISFGMAGLGTVYGLAVEKESRNWFPNLNQRLEWDEPLPIEQIRYIRQDVSVVHKIKDKQAEFISRYKLEKVISLEMRALFAVVACEVNGVQVNRAGWLEVIDRLTLRMHELERVLHLGTDDYEGLDVHILKVRNDRYMDKWYPYKDWMIARDMYMTTREAEWRLEHGKKPGWGAEKKKLLEEWYASHGKETKPPENKSAPNIGSWMQVRDAFNQIGIPVKSVGEEELTPHMRKHPLVKIYLDYVGLHKIVSLYGRDKGKKGIAFLDRLDALDRLRASYQQIGADTGRMASFDINLQQMPEKGEGGELRQHIIAAPGYVLLDADFSNIELRIAAELSGDKFLLEAFGSGQDLHAYTATLMFNLSIPEGQDPKKWTDSHDAVVGGRALTKVSYRKIAKTINYMLLYGAGAGRLASALEIKVEDARVLMKKYMSTYAIVVNWVQKQKARLDKAKADGEPRVYSETRSGRRRWFDIPAYPAYPGKSGERVSVSDMQAWGEDVDEWKGKMANIKRQLGNSPIQGLSADITKLAAALWYESVGYDNNMRLVAIIHDEFLLEIKQGYEKQASDLLSSAMVRAMQTYLSVVDLGEVKPVDTPYWKH